MKDHRKEFSQAMHREMPDILCEWRGVEKLGHDIEENLQIELERCQSQAFAEGFAAACPVEGCHSEDYLQRILPVGTTQRLLTGIRFHGSLGFPFVEIIAAAQPLDDMASLGAALEAVRAEYASFCPRSVRLLRASERPLILPAAITSSVDQHVVIGPLDLLATESRPSNYATVRLEPVRDIEESAAFVAATYAEFLADFPAFEKIVDPAGADSLMACQETGALAYIRVDGERAGLIATASELGPLLRGQCVIEEVLNARFRGHGLAATAQRRIIDQLAADHPGELIHGTIDERNIASRNTARGVGRREVAAWHWLGWE